MASRTDYKFAFITRFDDGTAEVKVRFYEGEINSRNEEGVSVTRYRRSALVKRPLSHITLPRITGRLVEGGNAIILNVNRPHLNAGQLRGIMNAVLAKDITRTAIDEQKVS